MLSNSALLVYEDKMGECVKHAMNFFIWMLQQSPFRLNSPSLPSPSTRASLPKLCGHQPGCLTWSKDRSMDTGHSDNPLPPGPSTPKLIWHSPLSLPLTLWYSSSPIPPAPNSTSMAAMQERAGFRLGTSCWPAHLGLAFLGEQSSKLQASQDFRSHPRSRLLHKQSISVPGAKTWASHSSLPPSLTGPIPLPHFKSFPQIHQQQTWTFPQAPQQSPLAVLGQPHRLLSHMPRGSPPLLAESSHTSEAPALHSCGIHLHLARRGLEGLGTSTCKWHWWCTLWPKGKEVSWGPPGVLSAGQGGIPTPPLASKATPGVLCPDRILLPRRDEELLERAQEKATSMLKELKFVPFEEKLRELQWFILEKRRCISSL